MKLLSLLLLAVALLTSQINAHPTKEVLTKAFDNIVTRKLNDKFFELIESLKDVLLNGNDTFGLPVMDPLSIDHHELSENSNIFSGGLNLDNVKMIGASNFEIEKAQLSIVGLKMDVNLRWSELEGRSAYNVHGITLNFVNVYGTGNLRFSLEDLRFSITASISSKKEDKTLYIKKINTAVSLGNLQISVDGLFKDEDLSQIFSAIASDLGPSMVQTYQKKLTEKINNVVMTQANKVLCKMTLKDLLGIIQ